MNIYVEMFWEFFKTGLFAIGGGLATLPFLYAISAKTGWYTTADVSNMIAISESTPGPLGINMATYVGYTSLGIAGCLLAPLSLVLPSVIVIVIVAKVLAKFKESVLVQDVFYSLRPASAAMIASAGISVALLALFHTENWTGISSIPQVLNYKSIVLALVILAATKKFDLHPIIYIVFAAAMGIVFQF